ncbi:Protein TPR1 [Camellia lanceoleosa]|uniref:Protein TPR1 n=1 Tax=Camellia lanceoleosa TaxID=1840588 RepID=A0ACC0IDE4_9ERIC|nr:Protein TPR1 [Camellia lanceoleosa]
MLIIWFMQDILLVLAFQAQECLSLLNRFQAVNGGDRHLAPPKSERCSKLGVTEMFSIIGKGNSCDILCNLSNILAARLGATPMPAFQFCLQFWMASSLLSDGLAIAGQVTYPTSHQHATWSLDDLPRIVACTMHQGSAVTSMDFHPSHHTLLLAMMVFDQ